MAKIDLRTEKQKQRAALHQAIIGEFMSLRKQTDASDHRKMCVIADKHGMTSAGIRKILVDNGIL